jgi:2-keto-4-pentenoate hydratase/2-oxohepta-3-ene-1,7-dioic acid hydratase in catechol pathway
MKLFRHGHTGKERPGVILSSGARIDASAAVRDYDEAFFGDGGLEQLKEWVAREGARAPHVHEGVRLGPPFARPSKLVCIGLNYTDHAMETGLSIPKEPVIFMKSTTSLVGPNDDLVIPRGATKVDWEVVLAVVIGRTAKYVSENDALAYTAGFALHNDYSEREFQLERGGQWVKGKSCDTFAPIGPFLLTTDELPDYQDLDMWLTVNGRHMQKSSTANMIFGVPFLVSYVSQFMTLLPGDVISTGTPAGVGLGMKPPVYLTAGDSVELGIARLGQARQRVVQED